MNITFDRKAKSISAGRFRFQWGGYKSITTEDVNALETIVNNLALSSERQPVYKRNIEAVSVKNIDTEENLAKASQLLENEGIVIVPGFLNKTTVSRAKEGVDKAYELISNNQRQDFENDTILVQSLNKRFKTYKELQEHTKAVADIRKGKDDGMIDIFNIDLYHPEYFSELREALESPAIIKLLSESGNETLTPANLNVYINENITSTRGFHIDTERKNLKAFVYLTDVETLDSGPYCYVRKTHVKDENSRVLNKKIVAQNERANTDAPFVDADMVTPALGLKGTLVISDQSGIHRGIPQIEGAKRYVAVMRYL